MIQARVLADSVWGDVQSSTPTGHRLVTLEVEMPRFILAEFNTHRVFSRNSASSRAVPVKKQIERVLNDPFVPEAFPVNQKGMSASTFYVPGEEGFAEARSAWLAARDAAVGAVLRLTGEFLDVHKQVANRLLEPFMWHTVIVSATEWNNFFALRCHPDAQPEMRKTAEAMRDAMEESTPNILEFGEWHLPFAFGEELDLPLEDQIKVSVGRCARVSYLTHNGVRDPQEDVRLADRLKESGHFSPWEHAATPTMETIKMANFVGWQQARWEMERS